MRTNIPIPFTDGFYQTRSKSLSSQNCVNWYVHISEAETTTGRSLYATEGISLFSAQPELDIGEPSQINRGGHSFNGVPYFVNGEKLYRLAKVNGEIERQYVAAIAGTRRVVFASSADELVVVVPDGDAHLYKLSTDTVTDLSTIPNFFTSSSVEYMNGYFVFLKSDSQTLFQSNLLDGLNYDALATADAEADPDKGVAITVANNQMYVLGTKTIQPYSGISSTTFTFAAIPQSTIDIGLKARGALVSFSLGFAFLGGGGEEGVGVYIYSGGLTKISTDAIDEELQAMDESDIENAFMMYLSNSGYKHLILTVGDRSFCFDFQSSKLGGKKEWFERKSTVDGITSRWRVNSIVRAYSKIYVADNVDGRIGELDASVGSEYGGYIRRECTTPPFDNSGKAVIVSAIEVVTDSGKGDFSVGLSYSDDNHNYVPARYLPIGGIGKYGKRAKFQRLGRFPLSRSVRLVFSGDYPLTIISVYGYVR